MKPIRIVRKNGCIWVKMGKLEKCIDISIGSKVKTRHPTDVKYSEIYIPNGLSYI